MFGRKKMYKKGLADAMQAYEAFGKKQEEALAFMREEVRSGNKELKDALAGLGEDLNGIYQYLNAQEKAALYQLSTPMDIKELADEEKRLLLAVLYQLAENEGSALTDDQRAYIRSVQKYLEITNPQTFADLSAIENIDSIDVQKTFLRVILEFFYLQDGDELSDEQEEIFDYFSVNKKQATIVENEVSRLFNAVGPEGVAEKYGYVPEDFQEDASVKQVAIESTVKDNNYCHTINTETVDAISPSGIHSSDAKSTYSADNDFKDIADLLMQWGLVCRDVIETVNYFYSNELLINKLTGKKTILSGKHLPRGGDECVYGDRVFYMDDFYIWNFDFSTCAAPKKLFDIRVKSISIYGPYLAFGEDSYRSTSSIYLYNIDTNILSKIADVQHLGKMLAAEKGIYYITELDCVGVREEYTGSIACLYDYKSKTTTTLFKLLPDDVYCSDIVAVPNDHIMYIRSHHEIYRVDFSNTTANTNPQISENLISDYRYDSMSHFYGGGEVICYKNEAIYVAKRGVLSALIYATGDVIPLAENATRHHSTDGGLFRKSSSWDTSVSFTRVGDWIYYKMNGKALVRVSINQPYEVVPVKEFNDHQELRKTAEKISFD